MSSNLVPQIDIPQNIPNAVQKGTKNISNALQKGVKNIVNAVSEELPKNIMNIFGYKLTKSYVYIFIGIAILVLGYFIYKWYMDDTNEKQDHGKIQPQQPIEQYDIEEDIPDYPPEQMHAPLNPQPAYDEDEMQEIQ